MDEEGPIPNDSIPTLNPIIKTMNKIWPTAHVKQIPEKIPFNKAGSPLWWMQS